MVDDLTSRYNKCTTAAQFSLIKIQFLRNITDFENKGNFDMVVLLRIALAQAKILNNELPDDCLYDARTKITQKSRFIENSDVLQARLLMVRSRWYTHCGDVTKAVESAGQALAMLASSHVLSPYDQAFGYNSSARSLHYQLGQRQSYNFSDYAPAIHFLDCSIGIYKTLSCETQRRHCVYIMLNKVKLLLHWLDNDLYPLRHDVTDDELSEAGEILDDAFKIADVNEPRALSRHERLQAVANVRKAQKCWSYLGFPSSRVEQQASTTSESRALQQLDTCIKAAFTGVINAHSHVCKLDTVELDQALRMKSLLDATPPFSDRFYLWTKVCSENTGRRTRWCRAHGLPRNQETKSELSKADL